MRNTFPKIVPKLQTHIFGSKIKRVLPREDAIYMVPKPLQKLGGESPVVSTVVTPLGIVSVIPMCPMS